METANTSHYSSSLAQDKVTWCSSSTGQEACHNSHSFFGKKRKRGLATVPVSFFYYSRESAVFWDWRTESLSHMVHGGKASFPV
jgi:hypothetical protein